MEIKYGTQIEPIPISIKEMFSWLTVNHSNPCLENSADPDQLALRGHLTRISTVFHSACKYILIAGIQQGNW